MKKNHTTETLDIFINEEFAAYPLAVDFKTPQTLDTCFLQFCTDVQRNKSDEYFQFVLFETEDRYAIGFNDLKNQTPAPQYYSLSKKAYHTLDWRSVLKQIKTEIKEIARTERFAISNLANSVSITIKFDDGDIIQLK